MYGRTVTSKSNRVKMKDHVRPWHREQVRNGREPVVANNKMLSMWSGNRKPMFTTSFRRQLETNFKSVDTVGRMANRMLRHGALAKIQAKEFMKMDCGGWVSFTEFVWLLEQQLWKEGRHSWDKLWDNVIGYKEAWQHAEGGERGKEMGPYLKAWRRNWLEKILTCLCWSGSDPAAISAYHVKKLDCKLRSELMTLSNIPMSAAYPQHRTRLHAAGR